MPVVMTAKRLRPWRSLPKGSAQDGGCNTRTESGRAFCGSTSRPPITAKAIMPNRSASPTRQLPVTGEIVQPRQAHVRRPFLAASSDATPAHALRWTMRGSSSG